jgi:hypothetical protein
MIFGAAATAASTGLNYMASQKQQNARDAALDAERRRQRDFDREAAVLNAASRDSYNDFDGQQDEKAVSLGQYFANAPQAAAPAVGDANVAAGTVMPSASNDVVTQEIAKQSAKAGAFTGQQANARGALRSFGDTMGGLSRDQARNAGLVGQIGGFKQGSQGVLPYELEAAAQSGGGMQLLADLLGGAGSVGMNYGITNGVLDGSMKLPSWMGGAK